MKTQCNNQNNIKKADWLVCVWEVFWGTMSCTVTDNLAFSSSAPQGWNILLRANGQMYMNAGSGWRVHI